MNKLVCSMYERINKWKAQAACALQSFLTVSFDYVIRVYRTGSTG